MSTEAEETQNNEEATTQEAPTSGMSFSPVSNTENETIVPVVSETNEAQQSTQEQETTQESEVEETQEEEEEYEYLELNADTAWEFLKNEKGISAENLDELLTPKEQKKFAPEMEKFNEFIEKTGNKNYNDFLETQKDWGIETPENTLRKYIELSNPDLSQKEINHLYNKKYSTEGLDEEDDEDEILEKGINTKSDLRKANEFFEKRKQEFSVVGGSDEHIPVEYREAKKFLESQKQQEEEYNTIVQATRNDFISKTESLFNNNFEGFKIQLGDEKIGFEDVMIKPENIKEVIKYQLDSNNLIGEFLDEKTGVLKDPQGYHTAMYMAKNYKAELNKAYNLGRAKQLEDHDKLSKNIQPDNVRNVPNNGNPGITFSKA